MIEEIKKKVDWLYMMNHKLKDNFAFAEKHRRNLSADESERKNLYIELNNLLLQEKNFEKQLGDTHNLNRLDKNFLMTMAAKQNTADRLGISLPEAWNGTGVNVNKQTGKDYAKDWEAQKAAAAHPKNKPLMDLINRAYADGQKYGLPSKANIDEDTISHIRHVPYKKGGMIDAPIQGGNKLI